MSVMVGTGLGATVGVLIKEAKVIEEMEKVNVLVIDQENGDSRALLSNR